jgi:hypothetical protein
MLIDGTDPLATAKPEVRLIKLLIRARRFNPALIGCGGSPFCRTGQARRCEPVLFHAARPPQLSRPDITQAILDGRQPRGLTAMELLAAEILAILKIHSEIVSPESAPPGQKKSPAPRRALRPSVVPEDPF